MKSMSPKLVVSAVASTLAMAAFAIAPPHVDQGARSDASSSPMTAQLPAPALTLPALLRR